jgi:hypothetical protein
VFYLTNVTELVHFGVCSHTVVLVKDPVIRPTEWPEMLMVVGPAIRLLDGLVV